MSLSANELILLKRFNDQVNAATSQAVADAMKNASELANVIVDAVSEKVSAISAPIMQVKVNDLETRKLDKPASVYLQDCAALLLAGENVYLKGPAGCGKTTLAAQAAQVLDLPFFHFVFAPDMGTSAVFGRQTAQGFVESVIVLAAKHGGVLFLDEMDNAAPEILVALNGLGDKSGTLYNSVTGETIKINENFKLIGAGNTNGLGANHVYTARQRQDAASLSRFCVMDCDYDANLEKAICKALGGSLDTLKKLHDARKKLRKENSSEVLSTRHIERVFNLMAKLSWDESKAIKFAVTSNWPEGLAAQVGLAS